ncbi:MAG: nucleotidyl transferase AbiEii/AbiGii toxin family protein [Planctomycetota bacterium]
MTKRPIKDLAASIRHRLQDNARKTGRPFQEVLQYFAMERFLYRLAESPHARKFVLKGALMFTAWGTPSTRPTKDIDFLVRTNNSIDAVLAIVSDICLLAVMPDGLEFDTTSLQGIAIKGRRL